MMTRLTNCLSPFFWCYNNVTGVLIKLISQEERKALMKEVSDLHHQLKALSNQQSPTDETGEGGEKSLLPLHEMVNECSKFIEVSLNERSQAENTIRELNAALHMKDKEIEDLMTRVSEK